MMKAKERIREKRETNNPHLSSIGGQKCGFFSFFHSG